MPIRSQFIKSNKRSIECPFCHKNISNLIEEQSGLGFEGYIYLCIKCNSMLALSRKQAIQLFPWAHRLLDLQGNVISILSDDWK